MKAAHFPAHLDCCSDAVARVGLRRPRSKEKAISKILSCRDVGVDCDFVAKADTEEEILAQCAEHARNDHGMAEIPDDLVQKVRGAIRDEAA